ncbi:MAG: hypothetical protein HQL75_08960 [Magnetococcales bacterium]|nr:hypothetical protein [Magnetococcales bacterium]
MRETMIAEHEMRPVPEIGYGFGDMGDIESLIGQANRSLSSISSLILSLDERVMEGPVKVMDSDRDIEVRRLQGDEMLDLAYKVRLLENMLYDRCS